MKLVCPGCKFDLNIPFQIARDFSPGGKEYHEDGDSYLICPHCGDIIELR